MAGIEVRRISAIELCEMLGIEDRARFIDIKRPDATRNDAYDILLAADAWNCANVLHARGAEVYEGNDPGISLFLASLRAGAPMPIEPGQRVLDLGCCEADWLHEIGHAKWPQTHFVGLDWRAPDVVDADGMVTRIRGNGLDPDIFAPESFDGIVSLSAVEHFGLGHYHHDPPDVDGDSQIIANCWRWLKPGGWLYFDVPYDPRKTWTNHTEYRAYDYWGLWDRLWVEPLARAKTAATWLWTGYAHAGDCRELCEQPTTQPDDRLRYYVSMVFQKVR